MFAKGITMNTASTLYRQAFIFNGSMDRGLTKLESLITEFLELNAGNNRPLLLRLTSSGGVPEQIFGLCGLIQQAQAEGHEVWVHVLGQLCGFTYMAAGVADKVYMEPTSSFSFTQMKVVTSGNLVKMASHVAFQRQLFDKLVSVITTRTNGKVSEAEVRGWKDRHITAEEAVELGLADEVLPMPEPVKKTNLPVQSIRLNGSFSNQSEIYDLQIFIHSWMERAENNGRPLHLHLTSWGGTVTQALAVYGLLCEAQRRGHHLTLHVVGEAYSCALWFITCALKSGTVLIDSLAMLMFHAPWMEEVQADLDEIEEILAAEAALYRQTSKLLSMAPGFTAELLAEWETQPDRYFTAQEAVAYGLGELVGFAAGRVRAKQAPAVQGEAGQAAPAA